MVPNSLTHILVSLGMQKRTKHTIQNTKCNNSPHPTCLVTHTYCNASWNEENQDLREAVEQCAEEMEMYEVKRQRGLQPCGHPNLHSSHPTPPTYKQMGVLTYTTLPDMLKPVVPGDENKEAKGGKDWTYWEQLRWKRGIFLGSQGGGESRALLG